MLLSEGFVLRLPGYEVQRPASGPRTVAGPGLAFVAGDISAAHVMENGDSIEQAQSPCTRTAHHHGQNAVVTPEEPAAAARSAGASLAMSGAMIASFIVRPQNYYCCTCASNSDIARLLVALMPKTKAQVQQGRYTDGRRTNRTWPR